MCATAMFSSDAVITDSFPIVAAVLLPLFWFSAKLGFILFLYIWVRGTLPRFRYDQLMSFAWTFMFPVALINLFIVGLWVALT